MTIAEESRQDHLTEMIMITTPAVDRRHDNITPVLAELHWLPVRQRVTFKTAVLAWKCLYGEAPCYLAELCVL